MMQDCPRVRCVDDRMAFKILISAEAIGHPVIAPPAVPTDRLAAPRRALLVTMKAPEYFDYTCKAQMDIEPDSGADAQ